MSASIPADSVLLEAVINTSGSVILGLYPDHRIFAWNRAAELLYQTPRATALGMDYVATFLAPEHRDAVAADIREVLAGKRTLNYEDDSILPDGTRRTLIWNVSRVLDAGGAAFGIVATGQDITERKDAEERFRLIFEHAQDGLLLSDDTGVIDCNPAALQMLGLSEKNALVGHRPAEFSPAMQPDGQASDAKSRGLGRETLERGALTFDWVHQRPDGSPVPVEVSVRHAMLNGRRVSVVAWHDRSHRLELERTRAELEERLRLAHKMEAVGQLAGGVAHDFNNLLAAIRNSIQLALDEVPADFAIRSYLDQALQSTERAADLTTQLLAFSRPARRNNDRIELGAVLREMLPLIRTTLSSQVLVRLDAGADDAVVQIDRGLLEQSVMNLVFNARDAMPHGGEFTLQVRVNEARTEALLAARDTGVGMDELTRERIFEPFFSTKAVGSGTGLGLAVVYGVVRQAGGSIRAESTRGVGTTMHIALPLVTVEPRMPTSPSATAGVAPSTVLLVDDDPAVRSTTRKLLEHQQFAVIEASNGQEALRLFHAERSTLTALLTDIRMPVMDGLELATAVRSVDPRFPVVLFSGFDDTGTELVGPLQGVQLLAKPFSLAKLVAVLRAAIEARDVNTTGAP